VVVHPHSNHTRQVAFRGRYENGPETAAPPVGADWIAGVNENWTQRPSNAFRVRVLIEHDGLGLLSFNNSFDVTYSHNGGPFTLVSSSSSVIRSVNSAFYTDQADTTDFVGRIGTGDWSDTDNDAAVGASATTGLVAFNTGVQEIEVEFCFEIVSADVLDQDTIELQWTIFGGAAFSNGYTASPVITVDKDFLLLATASGTTSVTTENQISWEQEMEVPLGSGTIILAFVGGIDSQTPVLLSTTISASEKSPSLPTVPLTTAVAVTGPGGSSFPSAWISYLYEPYPSITGTVTGTITAVFDEDIGRMQAVSAIISGTNGNLDGNPSFITQHTQLPEFTISGSHTTTTSGALLVDVCVSESSNHNRHIPGPGQVIFGDVLFNGPKISTSLKHAAGSGDYEILRSDCGGPFAGVTLAIISLESE